MAEHTAAQWLFSKNSFWNKGFSFVLWVALLPMPIAHLRAGEGEICGFLIELQFYYVLHSVCHILFDLILQMRVNVCGGA